MATEGNGGWGSSEEVREGQLMDTALKRLDESLMDDSIQNPWSSLEPYIRRLVREECELSAKPSPALVGGSVAHGRMEDVIQSLLPLLEPQIRRTVREAFEHLMNSDPAMVGWREQIQGPDRRVLQLHFQTSMPDHFFVGKKVEGRGGAPIHVKLIDATTGDVVESGALSSLTLDVVVLAGDFKNKDDDGWTWEAFKSNVETRREGKGPLLEGDLQVPLKEGVGFLAEFKFTDISTCRRSGKFRLGVKVEAGFFKGTRVREAKTAAFEVKHYKKKSEEKHVTRALDDDVCTLKGIGKNGPFHKKLNDVGIFKVKDFLWKRGLDPEGLREILGKTVSDKNWKSLGDHANESVPRGKSHVLYADNKNSGIVFKNMAELCGLIEGGEYHSAETLSDSQKVFADNLKKEACAKWKDIVEYDGPLPLEMNPSKRARFSQTDVVTCAPESCPSDIDLRVSPVFLTCVAHQPGLVNPGLAVGALVPSQPPSVPSGEASGNSMSDFEEFLSILFQDVDPMDWTSPLQQELSEKADGNTIANRSGFPLLPCQAPLNKADGNTALSFGTHGGSFKREEQPGGSKSGKKDEKEEPRGSKSGKKEEKKDEKPNYGRAPCPPMASYLTHGGHQFYGASESSCYPAHGGHQLYGGYEGPRTRTRFPPKRGLVRSCIGIKIGKFWELLRACRRLLGSKVKMEGGKTRSPLSEREEIREMASLDSKFEGLSVA